MLLQTISKFALATAAVAGLAAAQAAGPAGSPPGAKVPQAQVSPQISGVKKLVATYMGQGNGNNAALPQFAFTTIDSGTVKCGNTAGCTIGIESMAQIKPQGGDWAICLQVDGTNTTCQYQGIQGSTTGYVVGNARGIRTAVALGNHTVATVLYVEGAGCTYAYYETDYRVYKP